jgi:hypothetical protein
VPTAPLAIYVNVVVVGAVATIKAPSALEAFDAPAVPNIITG